MTDMLTLIGKGIMPFMGGMRKFMPWLHHAANKHGLIRPGNHFNDMTCGSASGAALFRAQGLNVQANDLSLRSFVSASAVFGGYRGTAPELNRLLRMVHGINRLTPDDKTPADELPKITEFLHPVACRAFDALYYAGERGDVPAGSAQAVFYRYMALRWVLLNKPFMYFLKLPTHDLDQLAIQGPQWEKVAAQIVNPHLALGGVMRDVNHLVSAFPNGSTAKVTRGDCREVIRDVTFGPMSITNLNPPTAGNSVFMQSNRVLDTLLFNEPQNLKDDDMPGDLWRSIILDTGRVVPSGHYLFSFCGDGTLTWEQGMETWAQLGEVVEEWSFAWHDDAAKRAGLVMIRRA